MNWRSNENIAQEVFMATLVTLDVFSGRPNPTFQLTPEQEHQLSERLHAMTAFTTARPSGVNGGLGYRGFHIAENVESLGGAARMVVHEGIVDRGLGLGNYVADPDLEQWLLSLAEPATGGEVREHVAAQIKAGTAAAFTSELHTTATACPHCHAADAPVYNPGIWNTPAVQPRNNCYNYANNQITNTFAQPGRASGHPTSNMSCGAVQPAAQHDGLHAVANFSGTLAAGHGWYVALVIWPGHDYHWYRQDKVGCWSHKPGQTAARNVDNAGHAITDPRTCNRGPYTNFCTYMVTHRGIHIR
jgi:hypothetical protein